MQTLQTSATGTSLDPVPLAPMTVRERIRDMFAFVGRPTPYPLRHIWGPTLIIALMTVFVIDYTIDNLLNYGLYQLDEATGVLPQWVDFGIPVGWEIFLSIILAPIVEEALFRGWLSGKIAALRFAGFGFAALAVLFVTEYLLAEWVLPLTILFFAIIIYGHIGWSNRRWVDTQVPDWFAPNFHWLVWGSSLVFGFYHVGNFAGYTSPLSLLIIVPYTLGGVFLAYTRTRLGLRAAMVHHALYNAMALLIGYQVIPWFY